MAASNEIEILNPTSERIQEAVQSQGGPRDAAVNFAR